MKYRIDGKEVTVNLSGLPVSGKNACLLDSDDNLIAGCSWEKQGFFVSSFFSDEQFGEIHKKFSDMLLKGLISSGCNVEEESFDPEKYHRYFSGESTHQAVVGFMRGIANLDNLPLDYRELDEKVSELCGVPVSCYVKSRRASGHFFIRIVRPQPFNDNNPPHKDVWLDRLRHAINLYLPLAGSDSNSSLSLVPGSHYWKESATSRTSSGAEVDGLIFSVPGLLTSDVPLEMIRPQVLLGEGMIFSPYLLHGGAVNLNTDKTRVSLEIRFWRSED